MKLRKHAFIGIRGSLITFMNTFSCDMDQFAALLFNFVNSLPLRLRQTSLTPLGLPWPPVAASAPLPPPLTLAAVPVPRLLTPLTNRLPTASTAPIGFIRLGPLAVSLSTRNNRTLVPFQTPTVPFCTTISEAKIKPQRRDSYQPRLMVVHSKECTRGGEASIASGRSGGGFEYDRRVRTVCRGRFGSQVSTQDRVGSNPSDGEVMPAGIAPE